jgi:hypothetical protein
MDHLYLVQLIGQMRLEVIQDFEADLVPGLKVGIKANGLQSLYYSCTLHQHPIRFG